MDIFTHWDRIKANNADRDRRHADVCAGRRGDMAALAPGMFPRKFGRQVTANIVNIAARDTGEMLGSLPAVNCRPSGSTQAEMKRATKKTRIAANYVEQSMLQPQMYSAGDRFASFGFMAFVVEPNFELGTPVLRTDNPLGAYYELDLQGRVIVYYKRWYEPASELAAKFPEVRARIIDDDQTARTRYDGSVAASDSLEVVKCHWKSANGSVHCTLFVPDRDNLVLRNADYEGLTRVPVTIGERPKWDDEVRGQFDEALWVQVARARMELYTMQAADQAVNAPIQLPPDVNKLPTGPQAVIRTNSDRPIHRVGLDIPQGVFGENARLAQEERLAARYPEGRSGNIDASVITGQGVQALLGTMDTQLKTYQEVVGRALKDALSIAFEMDELYWGNTQKTIEGTLDGSLFRDTYTPTKDIAGDWRVDVSYGFAAGLDPNRALVFLLQLRGDRLIDRDTVMRQLPFDVDVQAMKERIDTEEIADALKQGLFGLAASIANPELAAMGIDPRKVLSQIATVITQREKGKSLHDAMTKAFEPTEEELAAEQAAAAQQMDPMQALMAEEQAMAEGGGAAAGEVPTRGLGSPAGGQGGDLQMLLAGLTSGGNPNLQASVSRMRSA